MLSKAEVTRIVDEIVSEHGAKLYELEFAPTKTATVQVFVTKQQGHINLDECAHLHRLIKRHELLVDFFENQGLEVSSPGIERKLKKSEHFQDAVGERIKLCLKFGPYAGKTLIGLLQSFETSAGKIQEEVSSELINFEINDVKSAKVDFKF
ncbi:MAG: hypothetical protein WD512_04245 [Candidatus Paceibacterota bacterium]